MYNGALPVNIKEGSSSENIRENMKRSFLLISVVPGNKDRPFCKTKVA